MAGVLLKHVSKVFPNGFVAVRDFNMEIADGAFVVFVGPSGCGKSTILRMIAGLEEITSGELYIGDDLVNDLETQEREVAMIFQNYALYPNMTVYENMAFGLKMRNMSQEDIDAAVREAARTLELEPLLERKPKTLSGEQQQRVAMGRALVRRPKVFLMDEPLCNLDERLRHQMRMEMKRLWETLGCTVIYVTHDPTEAMILGTQVVVINDGVIQQVGTPKELYERPVNKFVAGLISSPQINLFDVLVEQEESCAVLAAGEYRIRLSEQKSCPLIENGYVGKTVICGIRPEDIHVEEITSGADGSHRVEAVVQMQEMLGTELFVYFQVSKVSFVTRVSPECAVAPGDTIRISMDQEKIHIFDKTTETTIVN